MLSEDSHHYEYEVVEQVQAYQQVLVPGTRYQQVVASSISFIGGEEAPTRRENATRVEFQTLRGENDYVGLVENIPETLLEWLFSKLVAAATLGIE